MAKSQKRKRKTFSLATGVLLLALAFQVSGFFFHCSLECSDNNYFFSRYSCQPSLVSRDSTFKDFALNIFFFFLNFYCWLAEKIPPYWCTRKWCHVGGVAPTQVTPQDTYTVTQLGVIWHPHQVTLHTGATDTELNI